MNIKEINECYEIIKGRQMIKEENVRMGLWREKTNVVNNFSVKCTDLPICN
jgi:hypothetical protein